MKKLWINRHTRWNLITTIILFLLVTSAYAWAYNTDDLLGRAFNVLYIAWISPGVGLLSGAILLCNPYYVDGEKR